MGFLCTIIDRTIGESLSNDDQHNFMLDDPTVKDIDTKLYNRDDTEHTMLA